MKHASLPIAVLSLIVCASGLCARAADATPSKPNIILILADDLGWGHVGWQNPKVKTPHLDRLAKAGVQLRGRRPQSATTIGNSS